MYPKERENYTICLLGHIISQVGEYKHSNNPFEVDYVVLFIKLHVSNNTMNQNCVYMYLYLTQSIFYMVIIHYNTNNNQIYQLHVHVLKCTLLICYEIERFFKGGGVNMILFRFGVFLFLFASFPPF